MMRKLGVMLGGAAVIFSQACVQDLNVTNPNNPDRARVTSTPADVQSLASSSTNAWYYASTRVDPWVMLNVTGDMNTMNYGNFGARFNNLQPRIPYNNDAANNDREVTEVPWQSDYSALGQANDVMKALKAGMTLPGGTDKYKALAMWTQAGALMQLSLIFDKAFIVDENTPADPVTGLPVVTLQPYAEVRDSALKKLDALIALTAGQSWTYTQAEFPLQGGLTAAKLNQFANTMAAQLIEYTPRNGTEAAAADYAKALQYANNGITGDFTVVGDQNLWWSEYMGYADLPDWVRVDEKLVHRMAPNVPRQFGCGTVTYPQPEPGCSVGTLVAPQAPYDARLQMGFSDTVGRKDYAYVPGGTSADISNAGGRVIGSASRGIYMQSPFVHQRYDNVSWYSGSDYFLGPMPYTLKAENDLLKAEALVRTGNPVAAAPLINNTYATRGGWTPLTGAEGADSLLKVIEYEREVELNATNGFTFFAIRKMDDLQTGTVRHLPVPASELETDGLPVYTFGGAQADPSGMDRWVGGGPLAVKLAAGIRPGQTTELILPNGAVMHIAPAVKIKSAKQATLF